MYHSAKTGKHRQNGLLYVPKKILTYMLKEVTGGFKATVGNRVQPDYHFIHRGFCSFLFLSTESCFANRLCSKACQDILDIVGLSQAEGRRTYLNLFNSHCCSFMKTNLRIIKAYQNT